MKKLLYIILAIVVIPILIVFLRKDNTLTTKELRNKYEFPNSNYLQWREGLMHYVDTGEGIPVLLIHGFAGSFLNWEKVWQGLEQDYRLVAVDLPGFGLSEKTQKLEDEPFIEMYCDFVNHVIEELNLDSLYIVGNSMGGYISWEMAHREQEKIKKLVLVNSGGYDLDKIGRVFINLSRTGLFKLLFDKGIPFKLSKKFAANSIEGTPNNKDIVSTYELMNRKETINTIGKLGKSNELADTTRILEIKTPTLIIWGKKDKVINVSHAYRFHRDIKNSELRIYDNVGHVPMLENPKQLINDLLHFFEQ